MSTDEIAGGMASSGRSPSHLFGEARARQIDPGDIAQNGSIKDYVAPVFDLPEAYSSIGALYSVDPPHGDQPPGNDRKETVHAAGCLDGDQSGGVCRPFNNARDDWMQRYHATIGLALHDMILPGARNAGADKKAPHASSNSTCQDVSPYEQMHAGIRAFDLRLKFYAGYGAGDPRRFQIVHGVSTGRTFKGDILDALVRFRADNGGRGRYELFVLDIHSRDNFNAAGQLELIALIKEWSGSATLVPRYLQGFSAAQWMASGKTTVVAMGDQQDARFWPRVNQRSIGYSVTSSAELDAFADGVVREVKPEFEFRALQYHQHAKVTIVADDISDRVMRRSASDHVQSPIQGLYILNTDWSLRQRMVDNCIHGNAVRTRARGLSTRRTGPLQAGGGQIPFDAFCVYTATDGDWVKNISLPQIISAGAARVAYLHESTYDATFDLHGVNNCAGMSQVTVRHGDRLFFHKKPLKNGWEICAVLHPVMLFGDNALVPTPLPMEVFTLYQTTDGSWAPNLLLPSSAHARANIIVLCNSAYPITLDPRYLVGAPSVSLAKGQQCAVQYAGGNQWSVISRSG